METTEQGQQLERLRELVRARGAVRRALDSLNEEHGRLLRNLRQAQPPARELAQARGAAKPVRPREESLQVQLQRLDQELSAVEQRMRARAGKPPARTGTPLPERRTAPRPAPIPMPDLAAVARADQSVRRRRSRSLLGMAWRALRGRKRREFILIPY